MRKCDTGHDGGYLEQRTKVSTISDGERTAISPVCATAIRSDVPPSLRRRNRRGANAQRAPDRRDFLQKYRSVIAAAPQFDDPLMAS